MVPKRPYTTWIWYDLLTNTYLKIPCLTSGSVESQGLLVEKNKVEEPLVKQHHWHDMWAVGEQGKDCNSWLRNSRKGYHATKAVNQHL